MSVIDVMTAFTNTPPSLDFIWPGFVAGTVGAFIAPGATGKSFYALEAAIAVACPEVGEDLIGLSPCKAGRVIYLAGEDPEAALITRLHAIGQHLSLPARAAVTANLTLTPTLGKRLNVLDKKHLAWLIKYCANARLIVLDTLSRIHLLDENSNADMAKVIATLEHVADMTGASVLYLHHTNKSSARDGTTDQQHAGRGASALTFNPRWCAYMARMTEQEATRFSNSNHDRKPIASRRADFVRVGISKQNYGCDLPERWYQRHAGGVLLPTEMFEIKASQKQRSLPTPTSPAQHVNGGNW